jgi:UDP-galactopyranose mutase
VKEYDYLIVGAGLFGSVFAYEANKRGKKCLVIDRRNHNGGNIFCENMNGINVHKYGAHIFHTNNKKIWEYVNQFVEFNNYINSPIAKYKNKLYNLPFNMNTFYQMWGVSTPLEAQGVLKHQIQKYGVSKPRNLEEQAINLVGKDIYEILIKGYTEKQWGRKAIELPPFIIKRLPVRFTYDNNYFNDRYQGIPIGGYNSLTKGLLNGIEVKLNTDYFDDKNYLDSLARKTVFTGSVDQYFAYKEGQLEYRSLDFEHIKLDIDNFQGNAVVNYTEYEIPYTRIIEHKHFEFGEQPTTVITKEYPSEWKMGSEPYYPINNSKNNKIHGAYRLLEGREKNVIFGGRLAKYKYYDMHQVVAAALSSIKKEFRE